MLRKRLLDPPGIDTAIYRGFVAQVICYILVPETLRAQQRAVAHDDQPKTRASQRHVQSLGILQESDLVPLVGPHAAIHDVVHFASLEHVHAGALDAAQLVLRKKVRQQKTLARVRRDHADLLGPALALDEELDHVDHCHRLHEVLVRTALAAHALLADDVPQHERSLLVGIGEGRDHGSVLLRDSVHQLCLVEGGVGELAQRGVHTVLDRQQLRFHAQRDQPLEERAVVVAGLGLEGNHHGLQLEVVAHQNDSLCAVYQGNDGLRLGGLRRLVDQHRAELDSHHHLGPSSIARAHNHVRLGQDLPLEEVDVAQVLVPLALVDVLASLRVIHVSHHDLTTDADLPVLITQQTQRLDVDAQLLHRRWHVFLGQRHETHHVHARHANTITDFVRRDVGGRAHEDASRRLHPYLSVAPLALGYVDNAHAGSLNQLVHDRGGRVYS